MHIGSPWTGIDAGRGGRLSEAGRLLSRWHQDSLRMHVSLLGLEELSYIAAPSSLQHRPTCMVSTVS
jgi:hypothetical protein